jgi:hypothetical protein
VQSKKSGSWGVEFVIGEFAFGVVQSADLGRD